MAFPGRILVWGTGAIGGTIAGHLGLAGHDVTCVDVDQAHLDRIAASGLAIDLPERSIKARVATAHPDTLQGKFDLVFLAVKADRTAEAMRTLMPCRAIDAPIVSLQNGLCELEIADFVGRRHVIGAFINFGADINGPGHITVGNRGAAVVGELDGHVEERTRIVRDLLATYEPKAIASDNIFGFLWGKQAYSAVLKSSALSLAPLVTFMEDPRWLAANIGLIREVLHVARAEGIEPLGFDGFDPADFEADDQRAIAGVNSMADLYRGSAKTHSSAWRDIAVAHAPTDAAAQTGPIFAAAKRRGISAPLLRGMIERITALEEGRAVQGDALVRDWVEASER